MTAAIPVTTRRFGPSGSWKNANIILEHTTAVIARISKEKLTCMRGVAPLDQALSPGCNALRQAGGELPRFRPACVDQAMARVNEPRPSGSILTLGALF